MKGRCRLCRRSEDLRRSHIISKFALRDARGIAHSALLRVTSDSPPRLPPDQSWDVEDLLCGHCEGLRSDWEAIVAATVAGRGDRREGRPSFFLDEEHPGQLVQAKHLRYGPLKLWVLSTILLMHHAQKPDWANVSLKGGWSHTHYLDELAAVEAVERAERRIARLLSESKLARDKTMATLDTGRFPTPVRTQIARLVEGQFVQGATNPCVFGNPGTGKSHVVSALGHELVRQGHSVLFTPVSALVERLLEAKRDLRLSRELRRLDRIECLILDDIGYVQHDRGEMEVLFALLAERYERRSVAITSNLVFSKWDQIFQDPMTTAAAIDRVVHHSVIRLWICGQHFALPTNPQAR